MSAISVLTTTGGIFGLLIAIFFVFFQIKSPIKISKKDTIFIIIWLFLTILGSVDIYYTNRTHNEIVASQNDNDDENDIIGDQESDAVNEQGDETLTEPENLTDNNNEENSNFSEEELLIKENDDLIQKLKQLNTKTKIIKCDSVTFDFYEKAGCLYSDIRKTTETYILEGDEVIPSKIIIVDYLNDDIIYSFNPKEKNSVAYFPNSQNVFYCIVFHENYNLYVTQPIQVIGGDNYGHMDILLSKDSDAYTPVFQLRAYVRDPKVDEYYSICLPDYYVSIECKNRYTNYSNNSIGTKVLETGILSFGNSCYFSLNTNYTMSLSLYNDSTLENMISCTTFNESITDTNMADIYFEIESEPNTNG